ncbi:uncharacterized protein F5Z01DRAFT_147563 [Emericellopsis atlantica]|uniref:F-box domain-containing protein n=1 Tax=Emericellopsis atlantica TaxID=2614577 RepID=A0A9P8CQB9_9HYPO|nr:uncharacterized protein F5Z01DRAFT_147563 [Emericellopsis atlantica]KAG9253591.1 hypothetical protein F5Z01DRAFT_147563 [Emericellopsis atlantica]
MEGHRHAMESIQTTEFGSKRFHDKIEQQQQQHQQQQQRHHQHHETQHDTDSFASGSKFILPLRESRAEVDPIKPERREKRVFPNLRHKFSFLHHGKPTHPTVDVPPVPQIAQIPTSSSEFRESTESGRQRVRLDELFVRLPNELQIQVIANLSLPDILNLRLSSKSWHSLITAHEGPIVRHHLLHTIPAYARRLYPVKDNTEFNFHYLCGLWHRLHVAAKLAYMMSEWITKDIFLRQTDAQRLAFSAQNERMRRRLIPLLFTIFHFFETYRKLHLKYVQEHGHGLKMGAHTFNPIEKEIMDMYDDETLLRVHEVFPLVISSFCRRLRPPTYVGRVERSLRGYVREKPSDDVHSAILCIGGLREVERLWEIKGYNKRRTAVDTWFGSLTKDALSSENPASPEQPVKTRRGLFGRKKSTSGESREGTREHHRSSFSSLHRTRSASGSIDNGWTFDSNWIFNTSLSAGVPMGSLSREQAQTILDDLPVLQSIWMPTAEALILQRKVVGRPQDIRRNQQVMLDLIREEGLDSMDEWCYGRKLHDSVKPPPTTAGDDEAD